MRLAADPLSTVGTMARDALRSWVQVSRLSETPGWTRPEEIVSAPHSTALFHLDAAVVEGRYRPAGLAVKKFEAVLGRLEVAAEAEKAERARDIEELGRMRSAALPGFNEWLDRWLGS